MRKYWLVFRTHFQLFFEYRADFIGHAVMGIITLGVMYFIWSAIYQDREIFKGYSFQAMLTYVLIARFLHFVQRGNIAREMATEIKEGRLSMYLLKPVNYLRWWFSVFLANRFFDFLTRLIIIASFLLLLPQFFQFPGPNQLRLFLAVLIFSLLINYFINLFMALAAFWVTDIRLFRSALMITIDFWAGALIPLDVMPQSLSVISGFLPFQFTTFFPIKIYQGALSQGEIFWGIIKASLWLLAMQILAIVFWRKGLKRYEAVGQ
jgi:ABC-2 type transport system permease protein